MITAFGALTYALAVTLGVIAWRRRVHLGRWHHAAYALACIGTALTLMLAFHVALVLPAACLVVMPAFRGRSTPHKLIGSIGTLGYGIALTGAF
jgi:hypothetical protein